MLINNATDDNGQTQASASPAGHGTFDSPNDKVRLQLQSIISTLTHGRKAGTSVLPDDETSPGSRHFAGPETMERPGIINVDPEHDTQSLTGARLGPNKPTGETQPRTSNFDILRIEPQRTMLHQHQPQTDKRRHSVWSTPPTTSVGVSQPDRQSPSAYGSSMSSLNGHHAIVPDVPTGSIPPERASWEEHPVQPGAVHPLSVAPPASRQVTWADLGEGNQLPSMRALEQGSTIQRGNADPEQQQQQIQMQQQIQQQQMQPQQTSLPVGDDIPQWMISMLEAVLDGVV